MELAAPAAAPWRLRFRRFSFVQKIALATALVALADHLFFLQRIGSTAGLFAAALLIAILVATPAIGRSRPALAAAAAALLFAAVLGDDPSPLAAGLFLAAAALAVLLPRHHGFDDGWRWAKRLFLHVLLSAIAPLLDWGRLRSARHRRGPARVAAALPLLALPVVGTALFLALFSAANPLISNAFAGIDLLAAMGGFSIVRLFFWLLATLLVWGGPSALLPLIELESRPIGPRFRERVSWTRNLIMDRLATRQGDWHGWTFRNARRSAEAKRLIAERRLPRFSASIRDCDGRSVGPPPNFDSTGPGM